MTGPEHWIEADMILTGDRCSYGCPHTGCEHEMARLAAAQVHATLALTAATMIRSGLTPADRHEWLKAIDPEYAAEQAAEATSVTEAEDPYRAGSYVVDMDSGQVVP